MEQIDIEEILFAYSDYKLIITAMNDINLNVFNYTNQLYSLGLIDKYERRSLVFVTSDLYSELLLMRLYINNRYKEYINIQSNDVIEADKDEVMNMFEDIETFIIEVEYYLDYIDNIIELISFRKMLTTNMIALESFEKEFSKFNDYYHSVVDGIMTKLGGDIDEIEWYTILLGGLWVTICSINIIISSIIWTLVLVFYDIINDLL